MPTPRSTPREVVERALPLAVLVAAVVSVPVMTLSPNGLARLRSLEAEGVRTEEEVVRLTHEIHRLRAEVDRIKRDPAAVERVARDQLGLVRRTEVVFQFRE